jgi:hypothetical protein
MLDLRPIPEPCEPDCIRKARVALREAWDHPDAAEIRAALDTLSHAILRLNEIAPSICDASVRESIEGTPYGTLSNLSDAVSDMTYALDCWRERNPDKEHAEFCRAYYEGNRYS